MVAAIGSSSGFETIQFTMLASHTPRHNHLLAALPAEDCERLLPHLEPVPLELGRTVYESGSEQEYVYFPTTSMVSLLYPMEDGSPAQIAIACHEGVLDRPQPQARVRECYAVVKQESDRVLSRKTAIVDPLS